MRVTRMSLIALSAVAVGALPTAAGAAPALPRAVAILGRTSGVVLVDRGRSIVVKPSIARRVVGARIEVSCADALGSTAPRRDSTTSARVRPALRVRVPRGHDYCVVTLATKSKGKVLTQPIAGVAWNAAGYDSLYELTISRYMALTSVLSYEGTKKHPLDAPHLAKLVTGTRVLGKRLTAIAAPAPDTQVGIGQLGVFTDGNRTSVTATTPGGRHLYYDYDLAARAVSTNVLDAVEDDSLGTTVESAR